MNLAFTITAPSLEDYVPHMKVQWLGSANHYDLVSMDMVQQVPEPGTVALLLAGLGAAALSSRRRRV